MSMLAIRFRILVIGVILLTFSVVPLAALRPLHLPQTVAAQFLTALQLRDFDQVQAYVVPEQIASVDLLRQWNIISGWGPAPAALDYQLVSINTEGAECVVRFDLEGKGTISITLSLRGSEWLVNMDRSRTALAGTALLKTGTEPSYIRPRDRARDFLTALKKLDFPTARELGTERTKQLLDLLSSVSKGIGTADRERVASLQIIILSEKIEANQAVVYYQAGTEDVRVLNLIKEGTDWQVDMKPDQAGF